MNTVKEKMPLNQKKQRAAALLFDIIFEELGVVELISDWAKKEQEKDAKKTDFNIVVALLFMMTLVSVAVGCGFVYLIVKLIMLAF